MAAPISPRGGKADKLWRGALLRALHRRANQDGNPQYLDLLADRLVQIALDGSLDALKEIGNRIDGRAIVETRKLSPGDVPLNAPFPFSGGKIAS